MLPVFFKLTGKDVLVIGSSDAAHWKAELLAATGARVHVIAEAASLSSGFRKYLTTPTGNSVRWHDRKWSEEDLSGKALAVADLDEPEEIAYFKAAAGAEGCPSNVIDQPKFCDFQFGSIVNRSPCIIGISTAGAAPVLGQSIRERIEALLPLWLADWGTLAEKIRAEVMTALPQPSTRRRFWKTFAQKAWRSVPLHDELQKISQDLQSTISDEHPEKDSRITEVFVPPSGIDDLRLRDLRALQSADIVYSEPTVADEVLQLARREAVHHPLMNHPVCHSDKIVVIVRETTDKPEHLYFAMPFHQQRHG
ncbi:siroheme synthase [Pseudovibrio japonicus]|uniref:precorrin-2 dehydrogenase n=1 Tax=Pseudovibrio japonicus TaxID=366534 RepID=A0ABQ3EHU1_9HYPH|nr:siroheme synthase [Pseudovibrio japonicus]